MKDGTLILWKFDRQMEKGLLKFVLRAITYFTDSKYIHVGLVVDDMLYEQTVWREKRKGKKKIMHGVKESIVTDLGDLILEPRRKIGETKAAKLLWYCKDQLKKKRPYNFAKLCVLAFVYPTRWFWNKVKWVPFNREVQGDVCSVFVDEAFKAAGVDLIKGQHEGFTSPGDFVRLNYFKQINLV
jgi:hypothetical protein